MPRTSTRGPDSVPRRLTGCWRGRASRHRGTSPRRLLRVEEEGGAGDRRSDGGFVLRAARRAHSLRLRGNVNWRALLPRGCATPGARRAKSAANDSDGQRGRPHRRPHRLAHGVVTALVEQRVELLDTTAREPRVATTATGVVRMRWANK